MKSKLVVLRSSPVADGRVALTPLACQKLSEKGWDVWIESEAGSACGYADSHYEAAATIRSNKAELAQSADAVVTLGAPDEQTVALFSPTCAIIGLLGGGLAPHYLLQRPHAYSLESLPRSSSTQIFDVLTSQSSLYGYWSVLVGASYLKRVMPMMSTPAGRLPPARVLVLGAGVAGLQAIATAKRLGAVVSAFDVRESARGGVESLDAHFYAPAVVSPENEDHKGYAVHAPETTVQQHRDIIAPLLSTTDLVIATAMVPGQEPPVLLPADMVALMPFGSVIVDIAADRWVGHHMPSPSGNCALSARGQTHVHHGVTVVAPAFGLNAIAQHASETYAQNILSLLVRLWNHETKTLGNQESWVDAMRLRPA